MKGGSASNDFRVILEPTATIGLDLFQLIKRGEHSIGQGLIGERP